MAKRDKQDCPVCIAIWKSYNGKPISRTSRCNHFTREEYFDPNPEHPFDMPRTEDHRTLETDIANLLFEQTS